MASPEFCSRCGSKLDYGAKFCRNCGISIDSASTPVQSVINAQPSGFFNQTEYIVDQKILALRDTFAVKNRQGELLGYVKKKYVSVGPQFWFEDLNGQRLGEVHGKVLTIHHSFEIFNSTGTQVGVVNKKIMKILGSEWWLESPIGVEVARVQGNIVNHDYYMLNPSKNPIAQIHKKWVSVRDSYGIELLDPSFDRLLILSFAIAMDTVQEKH